MNSVYTPVLPVLAGPVCTYLYVLPVWAGPVYTPVLPVWAGPVYTPVLPVWAGPVQYIPLSYLSGLAWLPKMLLYIPEISSSMRPSLSKFPKNSGTFC